MTSINVERHVVAQDGTKFTISPGRPMTEAVAGCTERKKRTEGRIEKSNAGVVVPRDRDGILWETGHPTMSSASPGKGAPWLGSVCGVRTGCFWVFMTFFLDWRTAVVHVVEQK